MYKKTIKYALPVLLTLAISLAHADDTLFSTNLHSKFQAKSCTNCHDFHSKDKDGLFYKSHAKRRDVNSCAKCHSQKVTSFADSAEWFAQPGLYTSGMDAIETCKETKKALHAEFKSDALMASQLEKHLLEDPRVLWGIEGGTPKSGALPFKKKERDMVIGGLEEWESQVMAWINGGMKCE
jgi:hypothetical protein